MDRPATIVGLGEVLWDVFPSGPRFGGAPANFACSAAELDRDSVRVCMVSGVGQDELGQQALRELSDRNVNTSRIQRHDKPTGQVLISLDERGVARYEFAEDTAWDNLEWNHDLEQLAGATDIVCFGTLGQRSERSHQTIQRFIASTKPATQRIFDVNLRRPFYSDSVILESLELANVLKVNDEELPFLANLCDLSGTDADMLQQISKRFDLIAVALTRGANGAVLVRGDEVSECHGFEAAVVDTVGAGDAFTAAFAIGLLDAANLNVINRRACRVAAFVCSQPGATPRLLANLDHGPA
jgi:fructokinase